MILIYLCYRKQGERRLVVRPVHLNFNYWKRTEEAGCATGLLAFLCSMDLSVYRLLSDRPVIISFRER